jgi:group I intron endonuclease
MICIYAIINILDDKHYVGQAKDRDYRWQIHRKELRGFYHHSILLQRAWSKYGEKNFIFVVLEVLDSIKDLIASEQKVILDDREQWWMDTLKSEYNISKVAGSRLGVKQSDNARLKMRESHLGKSWHTENSRKLASERMLSNTYNTGRKQTPERIEARAALHRKPKTQEHKDKIAAAQKGRTLTEAHKQKLRKPKRKSIDKNFKLDLSWDDILPSLSGS